MQQLIIVGVCILILACHARSQKPPVLDYTIQVKTALRGGGWDTANFDFIWTQARAAFVPENPAYAIMTMSQKLKSGSDVYYDLYEVFSYDTGKTWTEPRVIHSLRIHAHGDGYRRSMSDMTPQWHRATGKVLNVGKSFFYTDNTHPDRSRRAVAYAVYNPDTQTWGDYQELSLPASDHDSLHMNAPVAGCVQWLELPNGEVLIPVFYYKMTPDQAATVNRESFEVSNLMQSDDLGHATTVVRCKFDGKTLTYLGHGDEVGLQTGRGLYEPSLTYHQGSYFLTMRADKTAYVAKSQDGLHYGAVQEWKFDDGAVLGSYNTQQHWIAHSDGLFLVYTRQGANNDHVFRHRAPLFIAQVDPDRLVVIRTTERVLIPEDGVALGNFGVTQVNAYETWVTTTEYWRGESRNTDNEVFVARIRWNKPNAYAHNR